MGSKLSDSQYLDRALNYIVERERHDDYICEQLSYYPEDNGICKNDCQGLCKICVLRFLKHYDEICGNS